MENEVPTTNEEEQVQETQALVTEAPVSGLTNEQRTFSLCSYLIPLVTSTTFIVPLIIWLLKKGEDAYVEKHAKESLNFQISYVIFACVAWMSCFVVVGILLLPAVIIAYMVFSIVAAVKAYKGEDYKIPLCIRFIK